MPRETNGGRGSVKEQGRRQEPPRDGVEAKKLILAVGFDVHRVRALLRRNGNPLPGEPAIGVGALAPPWQNEGDRPLPWALTPAGRALLGKPIAGVCPDFPGHVPQPAHARFENPREKIRLKMDPGIYSFFVDDLDCGSDAVEILKFVQIIVWTGDCDFASGGRQGFVTPDGTRFERPAIFKIVPYLEPKGWSLQPSPILFPGELIVQNRRPSRIKINILKAGANPGDRVTGHQQQVEILINPRPAP